MQKMPQKPIGDVTSWLSITPQENVIKKWNAVVEQFNECENRKGSKLTDLNKDGVCYGLAFTHQQYCAMGDEDSFFMLLNLFDRLSIKEIRQHIEQKNPLASKLHKFIIPVAHLYQTQDKTSMHAEHIGATHSKQVHIHVANIEEMKNALRHLETSGMGMKLSPPGHAISIYKSGNYFLIYDCNDTKRLKTSDLTQAASYLLGRTTELAGEYLFKRLINGEALGQPKRSLKMSFTGIKFAFAWASDLLFDKIPDGLFSPVMINMVIMRHNVVKEKPAAIKSSYAAINHKCNNAIAKPKIKVHSLRMKNVS